MDRHALDVTAPVVDIIPPGELAGIGILTAVPVLQVRWFDERQHCAVVLRYLAGDVDGVPDDYTGCASYQAGGCARGRAGTPCAFHEPDGSEVWRLAASWALLVEPDGTHTVCRRRDAATIAADLGARIVGAVREVCNHD